MPDNWGFVAAAYGLTAVVLGLYWRHLLRREKELRVTTRTHTERAGESATSRTIVERSRQPSSSGQPRPEPGSRHPLQ
jgi:hypothetical protein